MNPPVRISSRLKFTTTKTVASPEPNKKRKVERKPSVQKFPELESKSTEATPKKALFPPEDVFHKTTVYSDEEEEQKIDETVIKCPFCPEKIPVCWNACVSAIYLGLLKVIPPMVRKEQHIKYQKTSDDERYPLKISFIRKNSEQSSIFSNFTDSLRDYSEICHLHQLRKAKEQAKVHGWPLKEEICIDLVQSRVLELQSKLDELINDEECDHDAIKREILGEFSKQGRAFFSKGNCGGRVRKYFPGYYGQKGQEIIHRTISDFYLHGQKAMQSSIAGMTSVQFVYEIMTPTAGCLLIQQDLEKKKKKASFVDALKYMQDTITYGSVLFPHKNIL